jgi:hypothetical protein
MIKPIVEGYGEIEALPILLRKIAGERFDVWNPPILRPGRYPSSRLLKRRNGQWELGPDLQKAAGHARNEGATALLILLDADADELCVKQASESLVPKLAEVTGFGAASLVFAVREYEAWLLASAESLAEESAIYSRDPEERRDAKGELERHLNLRFPYDVTKDQPAFTSRLDLDLCETRSRSFRKLLKEFKQLLAHCRSIPS